MEVAPDPYPATVLMANAMNTSATLTDLLRQGDIPRLLNQELKNYKPVPKVKKSRSSADSTRKTADSSSSAKAEPHKQPDPLTPAYDPNAYVPDSGTSRGEKRKEEMCDTPSPSLVLAKGLSPMPNGDVLQPFAPQDYRWDDLWLEQDQGKALREFTNKLLSVGFSEVDKAAVKEVCTFFMNLKKNTRLFQQHVDWKSPSAYQIRHGPGCQHERRRCFLLSDEKRSQATTSIFGRNGSRKFRLPVRPDGRMERRRSLLLGLE